MLRSPAYPLDDFPSIEAICEAISARLHINVERSAIRNCIAFWNRKLEKLYISMKSHGMLSGIPEDDWDCVMVSFEREYGLEPLFFQKTRGIRGIRGTYINPDFIEFVDINVVNFAHKLRGFATQAKRMDTFGIKMPLTGIEPRELLQDAENMETKVLDGAVNRRKYDPNVK